MIVFRVDLLELVDGNFPASEMILEESDMYKLLQRLGARKSGIMELKIERLDAEETETYMTRRAKYRKEAKVPF